MYTPHTGLSSPPQCPLVHVEEGKKTSIIHISSPISLQADTLRFYPPALCLPTPGSEPIGDIVSNKGKKLPKSHFTKGRERGHSVHAGNIWSLLQASPPPRNEHRLRTTYGTTVPRGTMAAFKVYVVLCNSQHRQSILTNKTETSTPTSDLLPYDGEPTTMLNHLLFHLHAALHLYIPLCCAFFQMMRIFFFQCNAHSTNLCSSMTTPQKGLRHHTCTPSPYIQNPPPKNPPHPITTTHASKIRGR